MPATDLATLMSEFYASYGTGDPRVWEETLTENALFVGIDQQEWLDGRGAMRRSMLTEMTEAGIRMSGGTPRIVDNGSTLWAADRPTIHLGDGSRLPARITVVAVRTDAGLRVQHVHLSVGLRNGE